jgi:PhzF family phenazine biosynthesis protein
MREFTPCLVDVGARWIVAQLSSAEAVLQNRPALEPMKRDSLEAKATGVLIFGEYKDEGTFDVKVRAYAPACGISEDPVCGSGNGAMAAFIRHTGQTGYFGQGIRASQGLVLGRAGTIHLDIQDQVIKVGGQAVTCIDGFITLP